MVGIYNTANRLAEYTPFPDPKHKGGEGDAYRQFLVEELIPHINSRFRTLSGPENTGVGGSSLGGLISLYIGFRHPDIFGQIMAMSPSLWWADGGMTSWTKAHVKQEFPGQLWIDMGTHEGEEAMNFFRQFVRVYVSTYAPAKSLQAHEIPGGTHTEAAWQNRMHLPLLWFFGTKKNKKVSDK